MPESQAPPPPLPDDVILEQILTRVPAAAAVRFRTVCRAWRAALTSDHFVQAYRAVRASAQPQPEIVFFAPSPGAGGSRRGTAFYTCNLELTAQPNGSSSDGAVASARELVTVGNLDASHLILSGTRPCHGLTLLFQLHPSVSTYHVCNLSTGEHVSLPSCTPAKTWASYIYRPCSVLSSTGLGFDPVAGEHKVVRLYEDQERQPRCEVYGLRSGGWRPCAGQVPSHAANALIGRPPVFLDGCFYWLINTLGNLHGVEVTLLGNPEPILSMAVDTEQFGWVRPPEELTGCSFQLAELDGSLCAVHFTSVDGYKLWSRTADPGSPPSWSLRLRISLASLPQPMRDHLQGYGTRMLPLASSFGGKILLATSRHEVHAYDPENNSADRVFSMADFMKTPGEATLQLLNIALHEESVMGVRHDFA